MVLAQGGQAQTAPATHGSLELALERVLDNHLWWLERLSGAIRRNLHRFEEGCWETLLQHTINHPRRGSNAPVSHGKCHRKHDVRLRWWRRQVLAKRFTNLRSYNTWVVWTGSYLGNRPCWSTAALSNHIRKKNLHFWRRTRLVPPVERHFLSWYNYTNLVKTASHWHRTQCTSIYNRLSCWLQDLLLWWVRRDSLDERCPRLWHWIKSLGKGVDEWLQTQASMSTHSQYCEGTTVCVRRERLWALLQRHLDALHRRPGTPGKPTKRHADNAREWRFFWCHLYNQWHKNKSPQMCPCFA